MVAPLAYAHVGFYDTKGNAYTLVESDTPAAKTFYLIPQQYRSSRGLDGKIDIAVSLCTDTKVPTAVITGFLEPYIPPTVIEEIKAKFGADIKLAPLPLFSAGRMLLVSGNLETMAITVDDHPETFDDLPQGIPEDVASRMKLAAYKFKKFGIRPALWDLFTSPDNGMGAVYPSIVGTNIGAKVPISIVARGSDNLEILTDQIHKGAAVVGQISYTYRGTIRPYYLNIRADISKIHQYMSANFKVGSWFASADVYAAVEKLKEQQLIQVEIYDENHQVTTKYNAQQILDKVLTLVLEAAFSSDPKVQAEKQSANAQNGGRFWWSSGGFSFRGSSAEYSRIFNFELKISGVSDPIPLTIGLKLDTPDTAPGCNRRYSEQIDNYFVAQKELIRTLEAPLVVDSAAIQSWLETKFQEVNSQ